MQFDDEPVKVLSLEKAVVVESVVAVDANTCRFDSSAQPASNGSTVLSPPLSELPNSVEPPPLVVAMLP